MDLTQFNRLAGRTKLQPRSIAAARRVLVDGHSGASVARDVGVSKQQVSLWCKSILRARLHGKRYPVHWQSVTVTVPPELAQQIRDLARAARIATLPGRIKYPGQRGRPPKNPRPAPVESPNVAAVADAARRLLAGLSAQQAAPGEDPAAK